MNTAKIPTPLKSVTPPNRPLDIAANGRLSKRPWHNRYVLPLAGRNFINRAGAVVKCFLQVLIVLGGFGAINPVMALDADVRLSTIEEIRQEAIRSESDPIGHPLPLAGHWNTGTQPNGFNPDYQMNMIQQGHYLLPWFQLPDPGQQAGGAYYSAAIQKTAAQGLPISFVGTQWESLLYTDPAYLNLPADRNPNVVTVLGITLSKVSPFGPAEPWRQVGERWTSGKLMSTLQAQYPNPPLVLFVSNNEAVCLTWNQAEIDQRYLKQYGLGKDDNFKRKVIGYGWVSLYQQLLLGMKAGLTGNWANNSKFIGYNALQTWSFGLQNAWDVYSLHTDQYNSPWPLVWDGASLPYYLFDFENAESDYTVYSPQVYAMNWLFMLNEARKQSPKFWYEMSTWDGHGTSTDKRLMLAKAGPYNPARYAGLVQFGAWLTRPRLVREFRYWNETLNDEEAYFDAVMAVVDRVHNNATLRKFWRKGEPVANTARQNPFLSQIPAQYQTVNRWFLLNTQLDPTPPWNLGTQLPVYAIALVMGNAPNREWLIYAFSPLTQYQKVAVTIPGYRQITVSAAPAGVFSLILEGSPDVKIINPDAP